MRRGSGAEERDDARPFRGVREETPRGPIIHCDRYGHEGKLRIANIRFKRHPF